MRLFAKRRQQQQLWLNGQVTKNCRKWARRNFGRFRKCLFCCIFAILLAFCNLSSMSTTVFTRYNVFVLQNRVMPIYRRSLKCWGVLFHSFFCVHFSLSPFSSASFLFVIQLIQSAGGDHDDCFGKSELLTRVQELQETTPVAITQPPSVKEERTEQGRSTTRNEQGTATSPKSAALSVEMNPAAVVSADGKVQAAATNERGEANQRISAAKGPKFSPEVLTVKHKKLK